jgi:NAD(P)H dehydrogenase (quinone)
VRSINSVVPDGVEKVVANLADPESLNSAFKGVTHATITIPLVYDPAIVSNYARNIANAAVKAGVKRLVFNANVRPPTQTTGIAAFDTRTDAEKILRASGIPTICLQPAVYLENLLAPPVMSAMKQTGQLYYPLPADMRVSWLSLDDLAKAVYAAHKITSIPDQAIPIGAPPLSGNELAVELSNAIGKPLTFVPLDPKIFEISLVGFLGADVAKGVADVYHWAFKNPASTLFSGGAVDLNKTLGLVALTPHEWSARLS